MWQNFLEYFGTYFVALLNNENNWTGSKKVLYHFFTDNLFELATSTGYYWSIIGLSAFTDSWEKYEPDLLADGRFHDLHTLLVSPRIHLESRMKSFISYYLFHCFRYQYTTIIVNVFSSFGWELKAVNNNNNYYCCVEIHSSYCTVSSSFSTYLYSK